MSDFEQKNMQMNHYERLREKYGNISDKMRSQLEMDVILTKLEGCERLTEADAQFLREQGEATGRLAMMLHCIAIDFYEQQYQQNDDFNELCREIELWETLEQSQRVIINGLQSNFNRVQANLKQAKQTIGTQCQRLIKQYGIISPIAFEQGFYVILHKLDQGMRLTENDVRWLKQHNGWSSLIRNTYHESEAHYYEQLYQQDQNAINLINAAMHWQENGNTQKATQLAEKLPLEHVKEGNEKTWLIQFRCQMLSKTYGVSCLKGYEKELYVILQKLEQRERLADGDVQWLKQHNRWPSLIRNTYHESEARYYEQLYQQDQNVINLINAAMHWQEGGNTQKAAQLTEKLSLEHLQEGGEKTWLIRFRCQALSKKYGVSCPLEFEKRFYLTLGKLDRRKRLTEADVKWLKELNCWSSLIQNAYHQSEATYYEHQYQRNHHDADIVNAAMHYWQATGDVEKAFRLTEEVTLDRLPDETLKTSLLRIRCVSFSNKFYVIFPKGHEKEFYAIFHKLDQKTRLTPQEKLWLDEQKLLSETTVRRTYHEIEATWYETEFQQAKKKNYWNLVNASSHWRGAGNSEHALTLTVDIPFEQINDKKLKSALLTTRGGALRDLEKLNDAEECAIQAMTFNPDAYQPYTLRGAIYYDRGYYNEGDYWFDEAIKRGATPKDVDAERLRIIKRITNKEERQKLIDHLLTKDSERYAWVKQFRENHSDKKSKEKPASEGKSTLRKKTHSQPKMRE